MKRKRYLSILLCLILAVGTLSGCGQSDAGKESSAGDASAEESGKGEASSAEESDGEEESEAEAKDLEFMEISVSHWGADLACASDDDVIKTIEEKFNIELVPQNITWEDHVEKVKLWASTDSLADITSGYARNSATFYEWAREGVIAPLPEDLSAYPNLKEWMAQPAAANAQVDGIYYCIPRIVYLNKAATVEEIIVNYRWDLAKQSGITEEPSTWEEFMAMLEAIMEADPEGKNIGGITAQAASQIMGLIGNYASPYTYGGWWVESHGRYVPAYFAGENLGDDMLPGWQLARDLWDRGLIDPDLATNTQEMSKNKFLNGQMAAYTANSTMTGFSGYGLDDGWRDIYGNSASEQVKQLKLMPSADGQIYYWYSDYSQAETFISPHVDEEKMDRILMLYDFLLSDEGYMLCKYGIEGESYEIIDGELVADIEARDEKYPSCTMLQSLGSWIHELPNGMMNDRGEYDWYKEWLPSYVAQAEAVDMSHYSVEAKAEFIQMESDFTFKPTDDMLRIMMGKDSVETMWNTILDEYRAAGVEDVIAQVNEAMD